MVAGTNLRSVNKRLVLLRKILGHEDEIILELVEHPFHPVAGGHIAATLDEVVGDVDLGQVDEEPFAHVVGSVADPEGLGFPFTGRKFLGAIGKELGHVNAVEPED